MIIDVHGHIGRSANAGRDVESLCAYMNGCNIDRVLISNLQAAAVGDDGRDLDEVDANLAAIAANQQNRQLVPIYWARPGRRDSHPFAAQGAMETVPFLALLLAPSQGDYNADDPRVDPYVQAAARVQRPVMILTGRDERSRPKRVHALARRFPQVPFIMLNMHGITLWHEAIDVARDAAAEKDADLYLETANLPAEEVVTAYRAVGASRMLFGSDAVVAGDSHSANTRDLLGSLRAAFSPDAVKAVLATNALRLFPLGPLS